MTTTPGVEGPPEDTWSGARTAVWWLAVATSLGALLELAMLRHWDGTLQLLPWAAGLTGLVSLAVARSGSGRARAWARRGLVVVAVVGVVGVGGHIWSNWQTAPLDGVVGPTWDDLGIVHRLWLASTGGVGPSPSLAPLILAQAAILGLVATDGRRVPATADDGHNGASAVGGGSRTSLHTGR